MGLIGPLELFAPILVIALFVVLVRSAKSTQPLVIKEWKASDQSVDAEGNCVTITGRQEGLIGWLLVLMKINPVTIFKISPERIEYVSNSLSGTEYRSIPILCVCSTYYGYYKPWKAALVIFGVFLIAAINIEYTFFAFFVFLLGLGASFVYYFLNRTLTLGVVEHSGVVNGIRFKRSVIEGVDINSEQGAYICKIIQYLIESRRSKL